MFTVIVCLFKADRWFNFFPLFSHWCHSILVREQLSTKQFEDWKKVFNFNCFSSELDYHVESLYSGLGLRTWATPILRLPCELTLDCKRYEEYYVLFSILFAVKCMGRSVMDGCGLNDQGMFCWGSDPTSKNILQRIQGRIVLSSLNFFP